MTCLFPFGRVYLESPDYEHDVARGAEDHVAEEDQEEDVTPTVQFPPAPTGGQVEPEKKKSVTYSKDSRNH